MATKTQPFFDRSFTCPICKTTFTSRALRGSTVRIKTRETDYHITYEGHSPLHYSIIVCPTCYYAATASSLNDPLRLQVADQVAVALRTLRREEPVFDQERDLPTVLRSFQLAVQSAQLRKASPGQLASSLLGAAWIAREMNDFSLETTYLNEARKQYELSYVQDKLPVGSLDEVSMAYLVGELFRRTENYKDAISWFGRALSACKGAGKPALEKMIRDQWGQARTDAANAIHSTDVPNGAATQEAVDISLDPSVAVPTVGTPPVLTPSNKNRGQLTLNAHIYQDQVEWIGKIVNSMYNQGNKITRDEVLRAMVDALRGALSAENWDDLAASNEVELAAFLQQKLNSLA